jgi:hypothetical protein
VSVSYRIDGDVVTIHPIGAHSIQDVRDAWIAAEADAAFPKPVSRVRICVDARNSESMGKRSIAELRGTALWFEQRTQTTSRIIAFITKPGLQYGFARMMATWVELKGYRTFVTTDPKQAVVWLKQSAP